MKIATIVKCKVAGTNVQAATYTDTIGRSLKNGDSCRVPSPTCLRYFVLYFQAPIFENCQRMIASSSGPGSRRGDTASSNIRWYMTIRPLGANETVYSWLHTVCQ
jgi:hypothetical protein